MGLLATCLLPFHGYGQNSALGARRGGIRVQHVLRVYHKNQKITSPLRRAIRAIQFSIFRSRSHPGAVGAVS